MKRKLPKSTKESKAKKAKVQSVTFNNRDDFLRVRKQEEKDEQGYNEKRRQMIVQATQLPVQVARIIDSFEPEIDWTFPSCTEAIRQWGNGRGGNTTHHVTCHLQFCDDCTSIWHDLYQFDWCDACGNFREPGGLRYCGRCGSKVCIDCCDTERFCSECANEMYNIIS